MHYHLIGICGTAMASLAGMLQARGHRVTGSDQSVYPPMSTMLSALGIELMSGYNEQNLDCNPDCVVIGNAISRGNPELEAVLTRRLLYKSQAEIVKEEFVRGRRSLVVAGTHGKTTTTSIAAWVLDQGGLNPGFLIGGVAQNFGVSFRVTDSAYFAIEGDEYDTAYFDKGPKFMHYLPEIAIVGNIEFDHADIYRDLDAIKLAFSRLMNLVPADGRVIAGWDSANVRAVVANLGARLFTQLETFGTEPGAKWQAVNIVSEAEMTRFDVLSAGEPWGSFRVPLIGRFNVRNCLAVIVAADAWGITRETIAAALASFASVKRRAEIRGIVAGVTVIDDFAHHPTAVRETLLALAEKYQGQRIFAIFEPRSWSSRLAVFQDEYTRAFEAANHVVVSTVFDSGKAAERGAVMDPAKLIAEIGATGKPAHLIAGADEIVTHLRTELRSGDIVAIMSNGDFGGLHEKLLAVLRHPNGR